MKKTVKVVFYFLFLMIFIINISKFISLMDFLLKGGGDFANHYLSGKMILSGEIKGYYDINIQKKLSPMQMGDEYFLPSTHPPFEGFIFLPFSLLPYKFAYITWNIFSLILLIFCIRTLYSFFNRNITSTNQKFFTPTLLGFISFAFYPTICTIINGQDSILFFFIFLSSIKLLNNKNYAKSGFLMGVSIFKPHISIPLAVSLGIRNNKNFLFSYFISCFLWTLISFLMIGKKGVLDALHLVNLIKNNPELYGVKGYLMPTIKGFFERHFVGLSHSDFIGICIWFCGVLILIGINLFLKNKLSNFTLISISVIISLLFSIHANMHDFVFLLFPLFYMLFNIEKAYFEKKSTLLILKSLLVFILLTPVPYEIHFQYPSSEIIILLLLSFIAFLI